MTCNDHVPQGERLTIADVKRTVQSIFSGVYSQSDKAIEVILSDEEPASCRFLHHLLHTATCVTGGGTCAYTPKIKSCALTFNEITLHFNLFVF